MNKQQLLVGHAGAFYLDLFLLLVVGPFGISFWCRLAFDLERGDQVVVQAQEIETKMQSS